jgi:enoyl-CoA hydratase
MEYNYLKTKQVKACLWVEIHNPPVNFLTIDILEELYHLVRQVEKDPSVRVFILTGGIEDYFISHYSIPELVKVSVDNEKIKMNKAYRSKIGGWIAAYATTLTSCLMDWVPGYERITLKRTKAIRNYASGLFVWVQMHRLYLALERMNKITIAAINGPCNGGGTELAYCFDFRFMIHDQDFTIGQPEILLGILPGGGGTQRLPRLIGKAKALEIMLRGNQVLPEEAKSLGLITDSFKKDEFRARVQDFADLMSTRSAVAVQGIKLSVHDGLETSFRHGLSIELEHMIRCFDAKSTKKALQAYAEYLRKKLEAPGKKFPAVDEILKMLQSKKFLKSIQE